VTGKRLCGDFSACLIFNVAIHKSLWYKGNLTTSQILIQSAESITFAPPRRISRELSNDLYVHLLLRSRRRSRPQPHHRLPRRSSQSSQESLEKPLLIWNRRTRWAGKPGSGITCRLSSGKRLLTLHLKSQNRSPSPTPPSRSSPDFWADPRPSPAGPRCDRQEAAWGWR